LALHVGFLAAEAVPYAKVGGLADVAGALPRELERHDLHVTLVVPGYRSIDRVRWGLRRVPGTGGSTVAVGDRREPWFLETAELPNSRVRVLFICGRYFDRDGIYNEPRTGGEFTDQLERWVFFCRAALAALADQDTRLDILHLNDHHTTLAAPYLSEYARHPRLGDVATFFSIHNLGYQGLFRSPAAPVLALPPAYLEPMGAFEFWGAINLMKGGLVLADLLGTVSPTYADEIQSSEEFGHGLEGVLKSRRRDLVGILNGIDTDVWNPATDLHLPAHYDAGDPGGKEICKRALLERLGLPYDPRVPVFASIGRLAGQKGVDLILDALPAMLQAGIQFVILGSGQPEYEAKLQDFVRRAPRQVAATFAFDNGLAHLIEAGADFFLMPSRYEPCGLNQMYSLRYGTVPVVRRTGGLADTVRDWEPATGQGNGFTFGAFGRDPFLAAVQRALVAYRDPAAMRRLRANGMSSDFSWAGPALQYRAAYEAALGRRRARAHPGGARV